ncbi:uncharacterized protein GLRG_04531 [Colletotrichum graminicola M1.001]|uniref:Uncharacterized protein n=1 Tax=Colletotrichum graminicola (strain M1.001 / M2 / FGSC 10212) TaxID=645133 RepID=E3QET1_COLGM|nr:uncharacterized protein GLRG_04531 [Colletotrichum graminicola M1.001]EFQ29387.1 hypothetical protein GLRG_04531 [Colletotrichum graminicola M1.001]
MPALVRKLAGNNVVPGVYRPVRSLPALLSPGCCCQGNTAPRLSVRNGMSEFRLEAAAKRPRVTGTLSDVQSAPSVTGSGQENEAYEHYDPGV